MEKNWREGAIIIITLALIIGTPTVYAKKNGNGHSTSADLITVLLKSSMQNTAFDDATVDPECLPNPTTPFAWHFILNGLDEHTTPAATLTANFTVDGSLTTTTLGPGKTQHFYIYTSTKDTLINASAVVNSEDFNNLVFSTCAPEKQLQQATHQTTTVTIPEFPGGTASAIPALIAVGGYLAIRFIRRE
jgi:hypothetical protein